MVGDYYERYWSAAGYAPHGAITAELEHVYRGSIPAGSVCLDVGCGDGGRSGTWLHEHGRMYVGVDLSFEGLRQAHAAGLRTVRISDASVLPFGPGIFDAAVSIEVLEHLFEPLAAAVEVFRVLKPGGVFVVGVPNVAYWRRRLELGLLGRWNPFGDALSAQQPWRDPHIRFFTVRALREMLRRAGFRSVSVRGSYGAFLGDLPGLRRWSRGRTSRLYSEAEQIYPALFGQRLTAVARKPG